MPDQLAIMPTVDSTTATYPMTRLADIPAEDIGAQLADLRSLVCGLLDKLDATNPREPRTGYSVEEVAKLLAKSTYTVREWARGGRIIATKRSQKRGRAELWSISAGEVARIKDEGLLPPDPYRNVER